MDNNRSISPNSLINNLNILKKRKNINYSSTHSKINKINHQNININTDFFNELNLNNNNISNKQLTQEQIILFQKKQIEDLQNKVNDLEKNSHKYQLKLLKAEKDFQNQKTINEIQNYKNTSTNFYMKTDIIKFWENLNQNFLDIFLDFENSPIIMFKLINLVFYICNQLINNFFCEKYNKTLEIINIPKNSNTIYEVEKNLMPFIKEHLNNIFSETIINNFYIEFKSLFKKLYLTMKIDKEENFNLMFESEKSFKSLIDNAKKLILVGLFNIEPLKFEIDINNLVPKIITINNKEEKNKFIVLNDNKKTQFKAVLLLNPPLFKNGHTLFKEMKPYIIEYNDDINFNNECENSIENNNIYSDNSFNFSELTFKRKIPSDIYSDNNIINDINDINNNNNENENILNNNNMLIINKYNKNETNSASSKKSLKIIVNNNNNLNKINDNKIINSKKQKFFHKKNNSITSKKKSLQISINNNNNFLDENKNSNKSSFICTTSILSSRTNNKRKNVANYSKEFSDEKAGNYFITDNIDFDNISNNNTFNNFNNNNNNQNNINNNCNIRTVNTNKYQKNKNTKNKNNNFSNKNKKKIQSGEKINYSKNFSNIQLQNNFFKNINISNFFKYNNNNKRNYSHTTISTINNNKNDNNKIIKNINNNIIINNFNNNKIKKPSSNRNFPKDLIDFHEILSERFIKFKSHKNNNDKKNNNLNRKIININNNNNYKIQNININLININNKYNSNNNNNNNNNIDIKKKKNFKYKNNKNNININNQTKNQESFLYLNDIDDINSIIYNKTKNNNKNKNDIIYTQIYNNNINYFNKKNTSQIKLIKNEKK